MQHNQTKQSKSTHSIKRGAFLIIFGLVLMALNSPAVVQAILSINAARLLYLLVFLPILVLKRNYLTHQYTVRVVDEQGCPAVGKIIEKRVQTHDFYTNEWVQRRTTDTMGLCFFDSAWEIGLRRKKKPTRTFTVQVISDNQDSNDKPAVVEEKDLPPGEVVQVSVKTKKATV